MYCIILCEDIKIDVEERQSRNISNIEIFPNPANNNINIKINNETGFISLRLYDLFGREIKDIYSGYIENNLSLNKDIGDINSGVYFLVMTSQNGRFASKIEVVK